MLLTPERAAVVAIEDGVRISCVRLRVPHEQWWRWGCCGFEDQDGALTQPAPGSRGTLADGWYSLDPCAVCRIRGPAALLAAGMMERDRQGRARCVRCGRVVRRQASDGDEPAVSSQKSEIGVGNEEPAVAPYPGQPHLHLDKEGDLAAGVIWDHPCSRLHHHVSGRIVFTDVTDLPTGREIRVLLDAWLDQRNKPGSWVDLQAQLDDVIRRIAAGHDAGRT